MKLNQSDLDLSAYTGSVRRETLKLMNGLFLIGEKLELATNMISVIIPTVPTAIRALEGQVNVCIQMLTDEVDRVSAIRPELVKSYGKNILKVLQKLQMALFAEAPHHSFRVFDESDLG